MKILDSSFITPSASQPIKQGTLNFLQQAYQEITTAAIQNLITNGGQVAYNPSSVYILYGCVNSGSGLNYFISAGAVYYNGEVFLVPSVTFTAPGGQVAVTNISTLFITAANADPVIFTDGSSHNVHQNRVMAITAGISGSGLANYSAFVNPNLRLTQTGIVTITGTYPNLTIGAPAPVYPTPSMTLQWYGTFAGSSVTGSGQSVGVTQLGGIGAFSVTCVSGNQGKFVISHGFAATNYFILGNGYNNGDFDYTNVDQVYAYASGSFNISLAAAGAGQYKNFQLAMFSY